MAMKLLNVIGVAMLAAFSSYSSEPVRADNLGPFMPNDGAMLTTAWTNAYGPDAESWVRFGRVTPDTIDINYSSSRGTVAVRRIRVGDRATARTIVLGYGP